MNKQLNTIMKLAFFLAIFSLGLIMTPPSHAEE